MKKLLLAPVLMLVLAAAAWAQDAKPSFSGKWSLDIAKSDFGPAPPPESMLSDVEHAEPALKVTTTQKTQMGEMTNTRNLTTDGKENTNKIRTMMGDQEIKSTTKWDGRKLVTAYKMDVQGMSLDVTETWDLAEDGKTLKIQRDIRTPQGDFVQSTVFNKQ